MPDLETFLIDGHSMAALPLNPSQPGIPVILVHGVVDSLYFWARGPAAPFLPFGPCTSLALPGHFPAIFPPGFQTGDLTAHLLAQLVAESVQQITGGRPALLVGHSTGAFAVLAAASAYPELVRGLVSLSGFARGRWSGILAAGQWLARHDPYGKAAFQALFALGRNQTIFNLTARFHTPEKGSVSEVSRMAKTSHAAFLGLDRGAMQLYFAAMRELDITDQLAQIRVPALIIAGTRDLAVPPSQSRKIAAAIPGAECALLPRGSHHPFFDNTTWYEQTVTRWLDRTF